MELSDYNALLDAIQRPNEWKLVAGLVGTSAAIREFAAVLATAQARFGQDPDGAHLLVVFRAPGCARLDNAIRELLGLGGATLVVLRRAAPFYNEGILFGVGTRKGVQGLEHIDERALGRLACHLRHWRGPRTLTVLLVGFHPGHESIITAHRDWKHAAQLKLPPLVVRREDIPWALHVAAEDCGGGLNDFPADALDVLMRYDWPGDLEELATFVRRLYAAHAATRRRSFGKHELQEALGGAAGFTESQETPLHLWGRIQNLVQECDRRTVLLMGTPFFLDGTLPAQAAPLSSEWPEVNLARLVSWSYMTFIEAAEPSAKIIVKLAQGLHLSMGGLALARQTAVALRTFEHHRLEAGSTHDKTTMSTACDWYQQACGRRQPELEDVERCISRLQLDIIRGLEDIVAFLQAVAGDEFRHVILQQWRGFAEKQWPKHRYDFLVAEVIGQLGRADLRPEVVSEKLLTSLQSALAVTADGSDKESVIRALIERKILSEFPREMPVDGRDIIELGIQGPAIAQVLSQLRSDFVANNSSRESLLVLAKEVVEKSRSTTT